MDIRIDLSGFGDLFASPEKELDLGDEVIVGLLVRNFVDYSLARFQQTLDGQRELDDVIEEINELAVAYNAVFLGAAPIENLRAHPWNSADQLGVFLRETLEMDDEPEVAVRATLIRMATRVMRNIQTDGATWSVNAEAMIEEVRDLLLGRLPAAFDDAVEPPPFG